MFGTGSQDDAVRIWFSKPNDDSNMKGEDQPTRKDDNLAHIVTYKTPSSPAEFVEEFPRTDSPIMQQFDSEPQASTENSSRERTIVFATPNLVEA